MPSMTGDELLARLREQRPALNALIITAHGDILTREQLPWWADERLAHQQRHAHAAVKIRGFRLQPEIERGIRVDDALAVRGNPAGEPIANRDDDAAKPR